MMMTDRQAIAFMKKVDSNAPFWVELHNEDRRVIKTDGGDIPLCIYNLMVTKRDVNLYVAIDMKPYRGWKISDVKKYFGLSGGKKTIQEMINIIHDEFIGRFKEQNETTENQSVAK